MREKKYTTLSKELVNRIASFIRLGYSFVDSCKQAGCKPAIARKWKRDGKKLNEVDPILPHTKTPDPITRDYLLRYADMKLSGALSDFQYRLTERVDVDSMSPSAVMTMLRHRFPFTWGTATRCPKCNARFNAR